MTRRSGLTLVEVLTALFILSLGVIAILTLFPLGAMQMAQAIRDGRSTESAINADQYFRTIWKTGVVEPATPSEAFYYAMLDPDGNAPAFTPAQPGQQSYPVAVDPMGHVARIGNAQSWVGDVQTSIPRRNLNAVTSALPGLQAKYALRLCSLTDTMGFNGGQPVDGDRELRYNWLWVLQMPNVSDPKTANMTVVVFDRRAHLHATVGAEDVLQGTATPGQTSLTFNAFNTETKIQPGTWIMDATVIPNMPALRLANFYRVTSVTDKTVELQTPIKNRSDGGGAYTGTFVVWRGVSGVFVRPSLVGGNN